MFSALFLCQFLKELAFSSTLFTNFSFECFILIDFLFLEENFLFFILLRNLYFCKETEVFCYFPIVLGF